MTPSAILAHAEAIGLTLTPDGEHIRVRGPREAIEEIAPLVKLHKPAIIAALNAPANEVEHVRTGIPAVGEGRDSHEAVFSRPAPSVPLDANLDALIQAAADYYGYDEDDLRLMRDIAQRDPIGLRLALETDPLRPFHQPKEQT